MSSQYNAPVKETLFLLEHCSTISELIKSGRCADLSFDLIEAVLTEAGKFASEILAPFNTVADREGVSFVDGTVKTARGHRDIYREWTGAGWNGVSATVEYGGQGLPHAINTACLEYWHSACMSFGLGPLLSMGAADTIEAFGTQELRQKYLPELISGNWMATMNLTEAQAGSDLGALRTKAVAQSDGSYRIFGSKIFITYGDHPLAENILHLVLARRPEAPPGSKGISLFLVPKLLLDAEGKSTIRNDLRCTGIEHKLGLHGSPTCSMSFGDNDGAVGWLIGEEERGLAAMFTMMNRARLAVAAQGVAIAEAATQHAFSYANERRQGLALEAKDRTVPSRIANHPDVARMLLNMKAMTSAARCIVIKTADAIDRARLCADMEDRQLAQDEADLLTPVAKAYSTDIGVEVASLGIQIRGGMGYVEESGAPQFLRDARIAPIYEGTNGIQAIDLVTRKLKIKDRDVVSRFLRTFLSIAKSVETCGQAGFGPAGAILTASIDSLEEATDFIQRKSADVSIDVLSGATNYLKLFGLTAGLAYLAEAALAAHVAGTPKEVGEWTALTRIFAEQQCTACAGLSATVIYGNTALAEGMLAFNPE
ncbi:acyl-CoA dehydrogenase family protein [Herbaspirillum lusitanum]|uniref:acyl-CoA dehydrogenase family protein n=1 Tax=Herbaspirillum lusitanum TaxID=213312 RepID=UPI000304E871|nr:acyl-CoA dehydrogenase family protein [Herbaspirillum lusitanum]